MNTPTVTARSTSAANRFAELNPGEWRAASAPEGDAIIVDEKMQYQEILGFGSSLTDAACFMLHQLPPDARAKLLREIYDPAEMGLNVTRICIGASDYAASLYSYDEGEPDPELKRFSIDHDRPYILPAIQAARAANPDLFLLASPWSPPGWMKANRLMLGGTILKSSYAPYARYFVRFLQAYRDAGVPVNAITVQNETDTDQDGRMPACLWGQEYEVEFVGQHLGPAFEKEKIDTRIWLLDHNYSLWGRAIASFDDPLVRRYADGIAWHGYVGQPSAMSRVHAAHPEKHMYWTEGGSDYTDPEYLTNWVRWGSTFAGILRNWARCIIGWNLVLDEKGRPNIGPFPCGGMLTIHSGTKEITRSGLYWAMLHYSKAVKRGARRVESRGGPKKLSHVAFVHPDGSMALVLTNDGEARTARVRVSGKELEIALPAASVATLTWRNA